MPCDCETLTEAKHKIWIWKKYFSSSTEFSPIVCVFHTNYLIFYKLISWCVRSGMDIMHILLNKYFFFLCILNTSEVSWPYLIAHFYTAMYSEVESSILQTHFNVFFSEVPEDEQRVMYGMTQSNML